MFGFKKKYDKRITLAWGDITELEVEAIVNAADNCLLGGGGVDGAIHRAAGDQLLEFCKSLNGCETGQAKITPGFDLPAQFIIHAVGPFYEGGIKNELVLLASCYSNSLKLAVMNNIRVIAFPNISTGVFRFPKPLAADLALEATHQFLKKNKTIERVVFIIYDSENYEIYRKKLGYV